MYTDKFITVSTDQTLTAGQTVIVSTDKVDLSVNRDIGEGRTLYAVASITEAPATVLTGFTATNTGDLIAKNAHGLVAGTAVRFASLAAPCGLSTTTTYYVVNVNTNDFQVSLALGGAAEVITADAAATLVAGPGAVYVQAITTSDAALTADVQVVGQSDAVDSFVLQDTTGQKQGYTFTIKLNPLVSGNTFASASQGNRGQRYLGLRYVAGAGVHSGHKITGLFTTEIQDGRKYYPSGFAVT